MNHPRRGGCHGLGSPSPPRPRRITVHSPPRQPHLPRRLVVLGEPGSGKSTLMARLVADLLERRVGGDPVPVLFPAATWNPAGQDLREWLAGQLCIEYPALGAPAPPGADGTTFAAALLAEGLIMPILDGLDEIPAGARGPLIAKINDALRPGDRLVVTSRTAQWQEAAQPPGGTGGRLRGAAGIQLCPLGNRAVGEYLRGGGPAARWDPVIAALDTPGPLTQVLSRPFMAGLARAVYGASCGDHPGTPGPAELCALTSREMIEHHLLDGFIAATYRLPPVERARVRPRPAPRAEKWLIFLAHHLEHHIGNPGLGRWQLSRAPAPRSRLVFRSSAASRLGSQPGWHTGPPEGWARAWQALPSARSPQHFRPPRPGSRRHPDRATV